MKHLRQYNEDVENQFEFDEEYIKECFIEFYDDPDKYDVYEEADSTPGYNGYTEHALGINCPDLEIYDYNETTYSVGDFIKISEELVDFYKEIEVCIEKVKIKYPDVDVILFQNNYGKNNGDLTGTRFVWVKFRKNI
jgi:hypothetical protein